MGRLTERRHKEISLGDVYILFLDSDDGYTSADIYQNPFHHRLKCMRFTFIKLIQIKTAWKQINMQMVILEEMEVFRGKKMLRTNVWQTAIYWISIQLAL